MAFTPLRWLARNFSTLVLAFILAVVVWVSAVVTADPNVVQTLRPVTIDKTGLDANLTVVSSTTDQARVTIMAPRSIWDQINNNPSLVKAWIDLSGMGAGEHSVPVHIRVPLNPNRIMQVDPQEERVTLEQVVSRNFPVTLTISGEPPQGYKKEAATSSPAAVSVSGPESAVTKVTLVRAYMDISGASQTVKNNITLEALDGNGNVVAGVSLTPKVVSVNQPISLVSGYKNVVVKVVTIGQVAQGYRLTSIAVTPPNVTLTSANPQLVNDLPGFIETRPVDLSNLTDDVEIRVPLNLPQGVSLVQTESVLVQVGVAALEGSITISLPVEILGLPPETVASISPASVDVIVAGPLPVLDKLTSASFRVVVNLNGRTPGIYQITPVVDLSPDQVSVQAILPGTLEVNIIPAPSPTPEPNTTLTPGRPTSTATPSPSPTPSLTPTAMPTPTPEKIKTRKP